jgi:hypothetical protein
MAKPVPWQWVPAFIGFAAAGGACHHGVGRQGISSGFVSSMKFGISVVKYNMPLY